jgi:hypothetical protein
MPPLLSSDLQLALQQSGDAPLEVLDPGTQEVYVLISRDKFARLRLLLEDHPLSLDDQRQLLADAGRRAGWDDPAMDAYDHYDEYRGPAP